MISLMRKVFPSHKSQIVKKNVKDEAVNPRVVKEKVSFTEAENFSQESN